MGQHEGLCDPLCAGLPSQAASLCPVWSRCGVPPWASVWHEVRENMWGGRCGEESPVILSTPDCSRHFEMQLSFQAFLYCFLFYVSRSSSRPAVGTCTHTESLYFIHVEVCLCKLLLFLSFLFKKK